jgi:UDP-N-acetylglucosamine 2-epimerase
MTKLRVMTVVGTRPEIIKLSSTLRKFDRYFDHCLVHTGQNYDYGLNEVFFKDFGLRPPDRYLGVVGKDVGETMGNVIAKAYEAMLAVKPDAVVVLGDTNSCLSVIAAKRLKVPIFHLEAGNRCKDENLPEEVIRRIVDVTSDVNLCYSEHARRYILESGVKAEFTFVVGSPMPEVLRGCARDVEASTVLDVLGLERGRYVLVSAHREENIDIEENFLSLMRSIIFSDRGWQL